MGLEMSYQAVPLEAHLFELLARQPELSDPLEFVPGWFRDGYRANGSRPWPEADKLWKYFCQIEQENPGLGKRNCYLSKSWDRLHYLLSATRREEQSTEQDVLMDKAVRGSIQVANLRASQGNPIMWVHPNEVQLAATVLESMSAQDLRKLYDAQKMWNIGIYKSWRDEAEEEWWPLSADLFTHFRAFYLEVARHHEGVFVILS